MRTDQSGARGRDLYLYKPAALWLCECMFPVLGMLCCAGRAETLKRSLQGRPAAGKSRPCRSRPSSPWGCLSAVRFSLLCCITTELFCTEESFLLHCTPNWGFLLALNWHQYKQQPVNNYTLVALKNHQIIKST